MFKALLALLCVQADSSIKADEVVTFFPTFAHLEADRQTWVLPIHGWIYEPEEDSIRRRFALGMLRRALGLEADAEETALFQKRARSFLVDNEAGKLITIRLGDRTFALEKSDDRGHFHGQVRLSADEAKQLLLKQKSKDNRLAFQAVTRQGDDRTFQGRVQPIADQGISVISDIDDTIKISEVRNKKALMATTFLKDFRAVPGMAAAYKRWAEEGAVFHYVSASPWQLYEFLEEFRQRDGFPAGSWHMKTFRWKDSSFFSLFASPEKYKPDVIEPILKLFPRRRFVLVGDSGEKDPEAYAALYERHPQQIVRILIRDVTGEDRNAPRYQKCFARVPAERWSIFKDAAEIGGGLPR